LKSSCSGAARLVVPITVLRQRVMFHEDYDLSAGEISERGQNN